MLRFSPRRYRFSAIRRRGVCTDDDDDDERPRRLYAYVRACVLLGSEIARRPENI